MSIRLLLLLSAVVCVTAADPALQEVIPDGVTPDPDQRAIVTSFAPMVYSCAVEYDADGNVRALKLSNHGVNLPKKKSDPELRAQFEAERPGVDDAAIARLAELPQLEALRLVKQDNFSDEALAVLQHFPDMKVFAIEYYVGANTADFMLHLDHLQNLEWLELKHLFGLKVTRVDELQGFPKLLRLELDNASAQEECLPFLERCPELRDLELHRTSMGNDAIGRLCAAVPKLERFDLKQDRAELDAGCLKHCQQLEQLEVFTFNRWDNDQIFWEDGVEHLVPIDSLKHIGGPMDHPAFVTLLEARPDIQEVDGREYAVTFDYAVLGGN